MTRGQTPRAGRRLEPRGARQNGLGGGAAASSVLLLSRDSKRVLGGEGRTAAPGPANRSSSSAHTPAHFAPYPRSGPRCAAASPQTSPRRGPRSQRPRAPPRMPGCSSPPAPAGGGGCPESKGAWEGGRCSRSHPGTRSFTTAGTGSLPKRSEGGGGSAPPHTPEVLPPGLLSHPQVSGFPSRGNTPQQAAVSTPRPEALSGCPADTSVSPRPLSGAGQQDHTAPHQPRASGPLHPWGRHAICMQGSRLPGCMSKVDNEPRLQPESGGPAGRRGEEAEPVSRPAGSGARPTRRWTYLIAAHDPHPPSSPAKGRLEDDGEAVGVGELLGFAEGRDRGVRPRHNRHSWREGERGPPL